MDHVVETAPLLMPAMQCGWIGCLQPRSYADPVYGVFCDHHARVVFGVSFLGIGWKTW